jgi:hypothetical protein
MAGGLTAETSVRAVIGLHDVTVIVLPVATAMSVPRVRRRDDRSVTAIAPTDVTTRGDPHARAMLDRFDATTTAHAGRRAMATVRSVATTTLGLRAMATVRSVATTRLGRRAMATVRSVATTTLGLRAKGIVLSVERAWVPVVRRGRGIVRSVGTVIRVRRVRASGLSATTVGAPVVPAVRVTRVASAVTTVGPQVTVDPARVLPAVSTARIRALRALLRTGESVDRRSRRKSPRGTSRVQRETSSRP